MVTLSYYAIPRVLPAVGSGCFGASCLSLSLAPKVRVEGSDDYGDRENTDNDIKVVMIMGIERIQIMIPILLIRKVLLVTNK